jgi:hypothetical protein
VTISKSEIEEQSNEAEVIGMSQLGRGEGRGPAVSQRARDAKTPRQSRAERGEERRQGQPQQVPRLPTALKAPRRSASKHPPHEPEIEGPRVDDQPLEDVGMSATQVNPAQSESP